MDFLKSTIVLIVGIFLCIQNWIILYSIFFKKRNSSFAYFLGGFLVCFGISIIKSIQDYWWLGLILDPTIFIIWLIQLYLYNRN